MEALFTLVYASIGIPLVWPPDIHFCSSYFYSRSILYGFGMFCSYFVLYFRSHIALYRNTMIKESMSKCWLCLNKLGTSLFLLCTIPYVVVYYVTVSFVFETTNCGCKVVAQNKPNLSAYFAIITSMLLFRIFFMILFIYPLYRHNKKMCGRGIERQNFVMPAIKRAVVAGGVVVTADFVAWLIIGLNFSSTTTYVDLTLFTCNLFINLIATLSSFTNWREKLFPFSV